MTAIENQEKEFSRWMRNLQYKVRLSQQEMADKIGIHRMSVSGYIKGSQFPSQENISKMLKAFSDEIDNVEFRKALPPKNRKYLDAIIGTSVMLESVSDKQEAEAFESESGNSVLVGQLRKEIQLLKEQNSTLQNQVNVLINTLAKLQK